jgi:hydrogenase small subunit
MIITRRQFLKYCAASATALGLSQTDLLRLEKAMAAVTSCSPDPLMGPVSCPRIIWIAGANCSGCATSVLNFVAPMQGFAPKQTGIGLEPEVWSEYVPTIAAAYPLVGALDLDGDGLLDIGDVAVNVISIDYAYIVAAAAGDVLNEYMYDLVTSGEPYVLMIEGSIQKAAKGLFCRIFEAPADVVIAPTPLYPAGKTIPAGEDVTMRDGSLWLAQRANCAAVIALGTCATWGGIPAAKGNVTGAKSAWEWLQGKNQLGKPIVNIPGCPVHPDWLVAPVLELILNGLGSLASKLDTSPDYKGRPKLTYLPVFPKNKTFCLGLDADPDHPKCPRFEIAPSITSLTQAGRSSGYPNGRCMRPVGCCGFKTGLTGAKPDCSTRMWNTHTNWCVGNNYPCQGCTDPDFPDGCSPFYTPMKGY